MKNEKRVWDPLVRIFHWGLVISFTLAYLSGEEENALHIYSGYVVLGLISFRIFWGFLGTTHARFRDFIYAPKAVFNYLKGLKSGHPPHYTGHNPAGGWMVILMLICLSVVSYTGLKVYAIEEGSGPLAATTLETSLVHISHADDDNHEEYEKHKGRGSYEVDDDEDRHSGNEHESEEFWEELHEASSNFMLFLILLHITGVIISSRLHRENLVKAMITGRKSSVMDS